MDSITIKAAEFIRDFDLAHVPAEAVHAARIGMVDCVGTMLAGAREPAVQLVATIATPASGSNDAPGAVNGQRYGAADAALVMAWRLMFWILMMWRLPVIPVRYWCP